MKLFSKNSFLITGNALFLSVLLLLNMHNISSSAWDVNPFAGIGGLGNTGLLGDGGPAVDALLNGPTSMWANPDGDVFIVDAANMVVRKVTQSNGIIDTTMFTGLTSSVTGDGSSVLDATGAPSGICGSALGMLYIVDQQNHILRQVDSSTGIITTIAGTVGVPGSIGDNSAAILSTLDSPSICTVDPSGSVYIAMLGGAVSSAQGSCVRVIDSNSHIITRVAGSGSALSSVGIGGRATSATLMGPGSLYLDSVGMLFIGEFLTSQVKKVDLSTGIISNFAGVTNIGGNVLSGNLGFATSAQLGAMPCITGDTAGNIFVAGTTVIQAINSATSLISQIAGPLDASSILDSAGFLTSLTGLATESQFSGITQIISAGDSTMYVCEQANNNIRVLTSSTLSQPSLGGLDECVLNSFAGIGGVASAGLSGDAGAAVNALLSNPTSLWSSGQLTFIADAGNNKVRVVKSVTGTISSAVFTGASSVVSGDGGLASLATGSVSGLCGCALTGDLFIVDSSHQILRKVSASTEIITTIAGTTGIAGTAGDGSAAIFSKLDNPTACVADTNGDVFVATKGTLLTVLSGHTVRKVAAETGIITRIAGSGSGLLSTGMNGPATLATICSPGSLYLDSANMLYIGEFATNQVRKVDLSSGIISHFAGSSNALGNLLGGDLGLAAVATLSQNPYITGDSMGNIFIAGTSVVRQVEANTGIITTIAGSTGSASILDSVGFTNLLGTLATSAKFNDISCIQMLPGNILLIASSSNNVVQQLMCGATEAPAIAPYASQPSVKPAAPSRKPTAAPSDKPSLLGGLLPVLFHSPSYNPTVIPSAIPTVKPSSKPTMKPSQKPTVTPTVTPSALPSAVPSVVPSETPSVKPSVTPSTVPTESPSRNPSVTPSTIPSGKPNWSPSMAPSDTPSVTPTACPSTQPVTNAPVWVAPSEKPTAKPKPLPTFAPTIVTSTGTPYVWTSTGTPSAKPNAAPSVTPSALPSENPVSNPSALPSTKPVISPTVTPSSIPNFAPTVPTKKPLAQTSTPSATPNYSPTTVPTKVPALPSVHPSASPSGAPIWQPPSKSPSQKPSTKPSTAAPSAKTHQPPTGCIYSVKMNITMTLTGAAATQLLVNTLAQTALSTATQSALSLSTGADVSIKTLSSTDASSGTSSFKTVFMVTITSDIQLFTSNAAASLGINSLLSGATASGTFDTSALAGLGGTLGNIFSSNALISFETSSATTTIDCPNNCKTAVSIPVTINLSGISSTQLQSDLSAQNIISTAIQASLSSDSSLASGIDASFSSAIDSIVNGQAGVTATFNVKFNANDQLFLNSDVATTAMSSLLSGASASGELQATILASAGLSSILGGSVLSSASLGVAIPSIVCPNNCKTKVKVPVTVTLSGTAATHLTSDLTAQQAIAASLQSSLSTDSSLSSSIDAVFSSAIDTSVNGQTAVAATFNLAFNANDQLYMSGDAAISGMTSLLSDANLNGELTSSILSNIGVDSALDSVAVISAHFGTNVKLLATCSSAAPVVSVSASSSSGNSVIADINFAASAVTSGTLYCAAVKQGVAITDAGQIISGCTKPMPYTAGSTAATVSLSGLTALTNYKIMCYLQTLEGTGSIMTNVVASAAPVTTACCNSLFFTHNVPAIFGDVSTNYASSPQSSFTFKYKLSAAPGSTVTVTPVIQDLNGNDAAQIAATPSSQVFTSTSSNLEGSFYLSAPGTLSGNYKILLTISGDSAAEFEGVSASFQLLASGSTLPPPSMSSCKFSDSGSNVLVSFSGATNIGDLTTTLTWTCGNVFTFVGADSANCVWLDSSTVKISFPSQVASNAALNVGNSVTLKANTLKPACSGTQCSTVSFCSAHSITVSTSSNTVTPVPVLTVPATVSSCTPLTFDATLSAGSGGREWIAASWSVTANSASSVSASTHAANAITSLLSSVGINTNSHINVPSTSLEEGSYTATLTLTNFLGETGSTSTAFNVNADVNTPAVSIPGSGFISVNPSQVVVVYSNVAPSACATVQSISCGWEILRGGVDADLPSVSSDSNTLIVPAHSLSVGAVYQAQVTCYSGDASATATTTIQVVNGPVTANVAGGYSRAVFITDGLTLDASASTDANVPANTNQGLTFKWTCIIASTANFGADCNDVFGTQSTTSSSVTLDGNLVPSGVTYDVKVKVSSADGSRSDMKTVSVVYLQTSSVATTGASTFISTLNTKFNAGNQMNIFGHVQANNALDAQWTASVGGTLVDFLAATPQLATFSNAQASTGMSFPLAVAANSFVPGSQVTFRLAAKPQGALATDIYAFSEIVMTINSPPQGGAMTVTPSSGTALDTTFSLVSSGWVDDAADYPLTYDFLFTVSSSSSATIKSRTAASSTVSALPAGLSSTNYQVTLSGRIYDSMMASTTVSTQVTVNPSSDLSFDFSSYLAGGLASAIASGNLDSQIQVVNNVAVTMNTVNCSGTSVSFCNALHRAPCEAVANTCGSCQVGFSGIAGPSNVICLAEVGLRRLASAGSVGSACLNDAGCKFGECTNNVCTVPTKKCPSSTAETCSGRGSCVYRDVSKKVLPTACKVTDTKCKATCVCSTGSYGGLDCSIPSAVVSSRDSARASMCATIVRVTSSANPSTQLLETLVSSLKASYSSSEVTTAASIAVCQEALTAVSGLVSQGLLSGSSSTTIEGLITIVSNFAASTSTTTDNSATISSAVSSLISGISQTMVDGQSSVSLAAENLQLSVIKSSTASMVDATVSVPATSADIAYGASVSTIKFASSSAMSACDTGSGYVDLSVMSWGTNPYANSEGLVSTLMRIESTTTASTDLSGSRRLDTFSASERVEDISFSPAYFVSMPFSAAQSFDFSVDPSSTTTVNFPECRMLVGGVYIPCTGCVISAYTNTQVTYACANIETLCGSVEASVSRRASVIDIRRGGMRSVQVITEADTAGKGQYHRRESTSGSSQVTQFGVVMAPTAEIDNTYPTHAPSTAGQENSVSDGTKKKTQNMSTGAVAGVVVGVMVVSWGMIWCFVYLSQKSKEAVKAKRLSGSDKAGLVMAQHNHSPNSTQQQDDESKDGWLDVESIGKSGKHNRLHTVSTDTADTVQIGNMNDIYGSCSTDSVMVQLNPVSSSSPMQGLGEQRRKEVEIHM